MFRFVDLNVADPFSMSAAELRERLRRKKHYDPRRDEHISLADKYRIVTNM